jgi:hypothetical protein
MRNFIDLVEANLPLRAGALKRAHGSYGAFIVVMSPTDFLNLTTSDMKELEQIKSRPFPQSADQFDQDHEGLGLKAGQFDMPFLYVAFPSGIVEGHEGRHRAAMVLASGGRSFPVMIYPRADTTYRVTDYYHDEHNIDHEVDTVFNTREDAKAYEWKMRMAGLKDEPMVNGWTHDDTKMQILRGNTLRGAPDRSSGWQYAAWKVEDFPVKLVGQFRDWETVPKTRLKIGIVKGYSHHKEPTND